MYAWFGAVVLGDLVGLGAVWVAVRFVVFPRMDRAHAQRMAAIERRETRV